MPSCKQVAERSGGHAPRLAVSTGTTHHHAVAGPAPLPPACADHAATRVRAEARAHGLHPPPAGADGWRGARAVCAGGAGGHRWGLRAGWGCAQRLGACTRTPAYGACAEEPPPLGGSRPPPPTPLPPPTPCCASAPLLSSRSDYSLDGAQGVGSVGGLAVARHLLQVGRGRRHGAGGTGQAARSATFSGVRRRRRSHRLAAAVGWASVLCWSVADPLSGRLSVAAWPSVLAWLSLPLMQGDTHDGAVIERLAALVQVRWQRRWQYPPLWDPRRSVCCPCRRCRRGAA